MPNIFCEDLFKRKLKINFAHWGILKGMWKDSYRVKRLDLRGLSFDKAELDEVAECLKVLKPEIVFFNSYSLRGQTFIEQPFIVHKLEVESPNKLLDALKLFKPSHTLIVNWIKSPFRNEELEAVKSLKIRRLEVEGKLSVKLLYHIDSLEI
jgi:hypothetical protein